MWSLCYSVPEIFSFLKVTAQFKLHKKNLEIRRWQPSRWKQSPVALAPNSDFQLIF